MKTNTIQVVSIEDVCAHNNLNVNDVMDMISESEVSFGNNADTLISGKWLNELLEKELDFGEHDSNIMISLGC